MFSMISNYRSNNWFPNYLSMNIFLWTRMWLMESKWFQFVFTIDVINSEFVIHVHRQSVILGNNLFFALVHVYICSLIIVLSRVQRRNSAIWEYIRVHCYRQQYVGGMHLFIRFFIENCKMVWNDIRSRYEYWYFQVSIKWTTTEEKMARGRDEHSASGIGKSNNVHDKCWPKAMINQLTFWHDIFICEHSGLQSNSLSLSHTHEVIGRILEFNVAVLK